VIGRDGRQTKGPNDFAGETKPSRAEPIVNLNQSERLRRTATENPVHNPFNEHDELRVIVGLTFNLHSRQVYPQAVNAS
jgi:hypothetical protein